MAELTQDSAKQKAQAQGRKQALEMLRAGKTPEEVAGALVKKGLSQKQAERIASRADDAVQAEISGRPARVCVQCGERVSRRAQFCDACGAKQPDEHDREFYRTQLEPNLVKGRKWIGAVAILYALGGIAFFLLTENPAVLIINLVLAAVQTGLWYWAKTNLLAAAVTALAIFVTVHLASAIIEPSSIFQGIVIKVVFVMVLAQTIRTAMEARSVSGAMA
jgi:hypothetical protein